MHKIDIVDELYEPGEGPAALTSDAPLGHALDHIRRATAQIFIVERLSHISNETAVQEIVIEAVRLLGGELVSVREPNYNAEPQRLAIRQALGFLNVSQKQTYAHKLRQGLQRRRSQAGRCEGRKPYGHSKNADEAMHERRLLQHMRELRNRGMSYDKIANTLKAEGWRPRPGQRWWGKTINLILNSQP